MRHSLVLFLALLLVASGCQAADAEPVTPSSTNPTDVEERPGRPADGGHRAVAVGDWPEFLGPYGTGLSEEKGLADSWPPEGPPLRWSKEIGVGYSAPSVLGERLVIHHRIRNEEIIECLDAASGESQWRHSTPTDFVDPYGYNGGPRCTPLLAGNRCYTFGARGTLCCVELASGNELWRREIAEDFSIPDWFFGIGCSPVLYGDLLIALVGGQPDAGVVAFNADTGETVWQAVGQPTWDGITTSEGRTFRWSRDEMLVSYSSPLIARIAGEDHLLCLVRQGLVSLDPWTGRERFRYWFRSPVHESVNAARPVVVEDRVLITASYRTGAAFLRVRGDEIEEVWRDRGLLECHWSTPIVIDGYAYGFSGRHESEGTLRCIDLKNRSMVWEADGSEPVRETIEPDRLRRGFVDKSQGRPVPWPYFGRGSKIVADGKAILLGERGTLFLADLSPAGYRERARTAVEGIGYPAWTDPVLSRGRLYLRDENTLVCLDVSKPESRSE